jgi:hypothetical protein
MAWAMMAKEGFCFAGVLKLVEQTKFHRSSPGHLF